MSTDYKLACFTCRRTMPGAFASSGWEYGLRVWGTGRLLKWLVHHEGHDLRIVNEQDESPWAHLGDDLEGK